MRHKQIIPCNVEMYATFKVKNTEKIIRERVLAFSLCDDDCIYPLVFNAEFGIDQSSCDDINNFSGYELI